MIRLAFKLIKLSVFALVVLILGNWLEWDGRTLSDHVRTRVSPPKALKLRSEAETPAPDEIKHSSAHPLPPAGSEVMPQPAPHAVRAKRAPAPTEVTPRDRQELEELLKQP